MEGIIVPNTTKYALEASLKKLLMNKTLDKITINDLTADCGISRMSFYYHFKDIDLPQADKAFIAGFINMALWGLCSTGLSAE